MRNLFINNKKLITRDFERYTATKIGKLQFQIKGQFPFYVSNNADDQSDQVQMCQNNFNFFQSKICRNVINKCPKLNCINPIQPTGFCCSLCGSLLIIDHNQNKIHDKTGQNYKTLNNDFIENTLINIHLDKYEEVNFFLSKISETKIEIIILDQRVSSDSNLATENEFKRQSRTFGQELTNFFKNGSNID